MNKNIALLAIVSVAAIMITGAVAPALAGSPAEEIQAAEDAANQAVADKVATFLDEDAKELELLIAKDVEAAEAIAKAQAVSAEKQMQIGDDKLKALLKAKADMCEKIQNEIDQLDEKGVDFSSITAIKSAATCP